jgi:hypothetical protein
VAYRKIPFARPSSNIADLDYDDAAKTLLVTFQRQGRQYLVHDIDANTVAELSRAPSAGRFYDQLIRNSFVIEEV